MELEQELAKALPILKKWGRKQNNLYDWHTDYIYDIDEFDVLVMRVKIHAHRMWWDIDDVLRYAINRWFNFKISKFAENEFTSHKGVKKEENEYHKEIDFYIDWTPFDLKMSVFPKGRWKNLSYALEHKEELANRLYENGSQEKRLHFGNKIFIVCYSQDGNHNRTKAKLWLIREKIDEYLKNYNKDSLIHVGNSLTDIIFIIS